MSFPKILVIIVIVLFGSVGIAALLKEKKKHPAKIQKIVSMPIEVELDREEIAVIEPVTPVSIAVPPTISQPPIAQIIEEKPQAPILVDSSKSSNEPEKAQRPDAELPEANRIEQLFTTKGQKLPVVETVTYKSHVAWQKGRPAWLSDYARHYNTSRHFIARSLNGKANYLKQDLANGDRFNVFKQDKNLDFYLVVDLSRCKLWLYYHDLGSNERVLLRSYRVGVGRVDGSKASGLLTPLGKYQLGNKVAIYKPSVMGRYNGEQTEMIRIFGSRWIPFEKELSNCTAPAKGFGIHGTPWKQENGKWSQDLTCLGKYQSDGCIRLACEDIEEIFAIIITKPAYVVLVKDFFDAQLPGIEKKS